MLSAIEAYRVTAVLSDTIEKLSLLGKLTPDELQHHDELIQSAGAATSEIIAKQRVLESRYEKLIEERSQLKGLSNKTRYRENHEESQRLSRELRDLTKSLSESFKSNPNIGGNLLKLQRDREQLMELLEECVDELTTSHTFNVLQKHVLNGLHLQSEHEKSLALERETLSIVRDLKEGRVVRFSIYLTDCRTEKRTRSLLQDRCGVPSDAQTPHSPTPSTEGIYTIYLFEVKWIIYSSGVND
jgi:hypothetical protein